MNKGISQLQFYQDIFTDSQPLELSEKYKFTTSLFLKEKKSKILDIGCGPGDFCEFLKSLSQNTIDITGVDISREAVESLKKKKINGYCVNVDSDRLPFGDNAFDGVFCGEIIEHLYDTDHLLDEIYRVLEGGGFVF